MHTDGQHDPDEDQQDEERLCPPTREDGTDHPEGRHGEARCEQPGALLEPDGRLLPGPEPVASVEVPVTEAADDLRGERGPRYRRERLGVLEDVDAVGAFDAKPGDPEQRDPERENAHLHPGAERATRRRIAQHEDRVEEPRHRGDACVDQRGRVGRSYEGDHEREQGGIAPSAPAHGEHRERDQPAET